eukprot:XP_016658548.1 PREDICTED: uncharacterized protein LOC103308908 [Acyrthosiphon pisum]
MNIRCCVPGCKTVNINVTSDEDIRLLRPKRENLINWSLILQVRLTLDSCICERHFRREDLRYPRVFIDGPIIIKPSLVPSAMPIPIDNVEEKYGSKRPSFDVGSNKKKKKNSN